MEEQQKEQKPRSKDVVNGHDHMLMELKDRILRDMRELVDEATEDTGLRGILDKKVHLDHPFPVSHPVTTIVDKVFVGDDGNLRVGTQKTVANRTPAEGNGSAHAFTVESLVELIERLKTQLGKK